MFIYKDEALLGIKHIRHGFFGRQGGISSGEYDSLNVAFTSTDDKSNVTENRKIITEKLGAQTLSSCDQIHSADIVNISANNALNTPMPRADGMVTSVKNIALGIKTADCLPVLAADRSRPVIGAVHAGWCGAHSQIVGNMIKRMMAHGSAVEDIYVAVGPAIHQKSYEVDAGFLKNFTDQHDQNKRFFEPSNKAGHYMFNLPAYTVYWLKHDYPSIGHVGISQYDTYSNPDKFFSYRRATHENANDYGRQMSAITLV